METQKVIKEINELMKVTRDGTATDEEITRVVEHAIENGVVEILLDEVDGLIRSIRKHKPC